MKKGAMQAIMWWESSPFYYTFWYIFWYSKILYQKAFLRDTPGMSTSPELFLIVGFGICPRNQFLQIRFPGHWRGHRLCCHSFAFFKVRLFIGYILPCTFLLEGIHVFRGGYIENVMTWTFVNNSSRE